MPALADPTGARPSTDPSVTRSILGAFSSQFLSFGVQFLSRVMLARLLAPEDFGVFALALFALSVTNSVRDFGISSYVVREDERFFGNALLLQLGAALLLIAGIHLFRDLLAPLHPRLPVLLPVLSLAVVAEGVSGISAAWLRKRLLLQRVVVPEVSSLLVFALGSLLLAWRGWGVWSLVIGHVVGSYTKALLLWAWTRRAWSPSFTLAHTGRLLRGSVYFFLIGFTSLLLMDLDKAILGLLLPAPELGYYVMAFSLVYLPCLLVEGPLRRVAYPALTIAATDRSRLRATYRHFTLLSLAFEVPLYAFVAINAEAIVIALYGGEWGPVVPLVVWMSFLPLVDPFSKFGNSLLQAVGKESVQYFAALPYVVFFAGLAYLLTGRHGVWGMILANYLQVGGWAITYYYLRVVGDAGRLVREVLGLYAFSAVALAVPWAVAGSSATGSLILSSTFLLLAWGALLWYLVPTGLRTPRLLLARAVVEYRQLR